VLWIVLDGMGAEHFTYALKQGRYAAINRVAREGFITPMQPASPVCQTPPALLALFTGTQPAENGVWGYYMPHPSKREGSLSGFHADLGKVRTLWQELEERGERYSLMNVAFRADPVWRGPSPHLVFGFDGYRLWKKPTLYHLGGGGPRISFHGIRMRARREKGGTVCLWKGASLCARLAVGQGMSVRITSGTRVFAHLLTPELLLLNPMNGVVCRGTATPSHGCDGFLEMSAFHLVRRINASRPPSLTASVESELLPSRVSFQRKADVMLEQSRNRNARLVVGYFPVVDDFNHAYFDLLQQDDERAAALFRGCLDLVDGLLGRLMAEMGDDMLLVVSSDHGAMAHRSMLHINEAFADAGLVRRGPAGYDFGTSTAWYHPSDCGQVVARGSPDRALVLRRVEAVIQGLNRELDANIAVLGGDARSPYVAFLFPRGDLYFTGRPPRKGGKSLERKRAGAHHLSPLSPTPWIGAALGVWSPGLERRSVPFMPKENVEMKKFLMESMGLT
jgi:hypothetical protein